MAISDITRVEGAIHNPADPRHFMRIRPAGRRLRVLHQSRVIAETRDALRVLEIGRDFYDPAWYLPRDAVSAPLSPIDLATRCPIKGEASYFDLRNAPDGSPLAHKIAWSYENPIPEAVALAGHIAFYADQVTFEDSPL